MADAVSADRISVLFDEAEIARQVERLAGEIAAQAGKRIQLVAVLRGSFVFTADLMRALHRAGVEPQVDFMTLSSYGAGKTSSGHVQVLRDISDSVEGQVVVLVDDILESGRTLAYARDLLLGRGAKAVRVCILLDKKHKRIADIEADFVGFDCPDKFVVGYGLDFAHRYRELPFIGDVGD